jgi:hypothetical protein
MTAGKLQRLSILVEDVKRLQPLSRQIAFAHLSDQQQARHDHILQPLVVQSDLTTISSSQNSQSKASALGQQECTIQLRSEKSSVSIQ